MHPFFELLRARLPSSLEHALLFIESAYSGTDTIREIPAFEDVCEEVLGDIARYRYVLVFSPRSETPFPRFCSIYSLCQ